MNDLAAAMIITGAAVLAALGAYYVADVVTLRLAVRRSVAKPLPAINAAWPCDALPMNEASLCKEITPRYVAIAEAEEIFRSAWLAWGSERVKEHADD